MDMFLGITDGGQTLVIPYCDSNGRRSMIKKKEKKNTVVFSPTASQPLSSHWTDVTCNFSCSSSYPFRQERVSPPSKVISLVSFNFLLVHATIPSPLDLINIPPLSPSTERSSSPG